MTLSATSYLAILAAAAAAFAFGAVWYSAFARPWMTDVGYSTKPTPRVLPYLVAFIAELVMAWTIVGVTAHIGPVTVRSTVVTAIFLWAGLILTTMIVNHSYEARPKRLTLINGGHWLGVVLVMALVIGAFGG